MYIVPPPFFFSSSHKNCPVLDHVYYSLTCGNSRLLRAVTFGNGHLRAVTLGKARCLVGPGEIIVVFILLPDAAFVMLQCPLLMTDYPGLSLLDLYILIKVIKLKNCAIDCTFGLPLVVHG